MVRGRSFASMSCSKLWIHPESVALRAGRKMCAVIPAPSWQGVPLARPRCIPPAHDAHPASSRKPRQQTVSPVNHSADLEPSRSTATAPWRNVATVPSSLGRSLHTPPRPPWSGVLPLNHAREISLSRPIDQRAFRRPLAPTSSADHGFSPRTGRKLME